MDSNILDYVILALIFAVAIYVLFQLFGHGRCGREFMNESTSNGTNGYFIMDDCKQDKRCYIPGVENENDNGDMFNKMKHGVVTNVIEVDKKEENKNDDDKKQENFDETDKQNDEKVDKAVKKIGCPVNQMEDEKDRYIRDIVLGGKYQCPNRVRETKKMTAEEIRDYQNTFFGFQNKVNRASSEGTDPVDRVNEMLTSKNNEMTNYEGKKISDIYNDLTQSKLDKEKNCVNTSCIIPMEIDEKYRTGVYREKTHNGDTFSKYNWRYEHDGVNNGGKFYDEIEGSDSEFEYNLAWTK